MNVTDRKLRPSNHYATFTRANQLIVLLGSFRCDELQFLLDSVVARNTP